MKAKSFHEENFRPGMAYVRWKMAGFPKYGLSMGLNGLGRVVKCEVGKELFFQKNKERTCYKHNRHAKKD